MATTCPPLPQPQRETHPQKEKVQTFIPCQTTTIESSPAGRSDSRPPASRFSSPHAQLPNVDNYRSAEK
jgi:hypothetical protein